jgi:hypothetical protein
MIFATAIPPLAPAPQTKEQHPEAGAPHFVEK